MSELIRRDLLPGLYITFGQDGTWLHFESSVRSGAFNLEVLVEQGVIAGESVGAWIEAYRKTLEKSMSEPHQGLTRYVPRILQDSGMVTHAEVNHYEHLNLEQYYKASDVDATVDEMRDVLDVLIRFIPDIGRLSKVKALVATLGEESS